MSAQPRFVSVSAWIVTVVLAAMMGFHIGQSTEVRAAESVQVLLDADRAFDRDTAVRRIDGWVDAFADDGRMFPEGQEVVQGKPGIRELMDGYFANPTASLRWEPVGGDISASGDLGYTYGHSTSSRTADGKRAENFGKYVTIWKKQADGKWKVALDIGNSRPKP